MLSALKADLASWKESLLGIVNSLLENVLLWLISYYFQINICTQICCCVEGKQNHISSDPVPQPLYLGSPTSQFPRDRHFPHFGLTILAFEFIYINTVLIPLYHGLYIYIYVLSSNLIENLIFLTPSEGHNPLYLKFSR